MTPARPLFMAATRYVSSSWIWEPFVVCPLLHSVDHTGDGRNEEAESLFITYAVFFNELSGSGTNGYVTSCR
jgi:hypothetical protein